MINATVIMAAMKVKIAAKTTCIHVMVSYRENKHYFALLH